ncbi:MAG TPA: hypothetical protein VGH59_06450 [Casimicrobiaceae bacterium]
MDDLPNACSRHATYEPQAPGKCRLDRSSQLRPRLLRLVGIVVLQVVPPHAAAGEYMVTARVVVVFGTAAPGEIRKYYREQVQDLVYGALTK